MSMFRTASILVAIALVTAGCSSPADTTDEPSSSASAVGTRADRLTLDVDCDDDERDAFVLTLASYSANGETGTLTGKTARGLTVSVPVLATTNARRAPINQWPPVPVRENAVAWNARIAASGPAFGAPSALEGGSFASLTLAFASAHSRMRVVLSESGAAKALRPLP
jgi:hypothetical protein